MNRRRLPFGAPWILVVGAACGTAKLTPTQCEQLREDTPCDSDQKCNTDQHGCGLNGFTCRDGKWHALITYCNPPGPSPSPAK